MAGKTGRPFSIPAIASSSAVASRDIEKSRQFIDECQRQSPFETPPCALGSYEELIASPECGRRLHSAANRLAQGMGLARGGSRQTCPLRKTVRRRARPDCDEMLSACRENSVQFMDGVMFMHSPRLPRVREILDDGKSVGPVRRISSAFSFLGRRGFFP